MPAVARLPSGTFVDVLCGHPEQKKGVRAKSVSDLISPFCLSCINFNFSRMDASSLNCKIRDAITFAISDGFNSPAAGCKN